MKMNLIEKLSIEQYEMSSDDKTFVKQNDSMFHLIRGKKMPIDRSNDSSSRSICSRKINIFR